METIMFLLLLNLFKKIKIIKEKSLFKQKTINCKKKKIIMFIILFF